jgi:hypothetical protein
VPARKHNAAREREIVAPLLRGRSRRIACALLASLALCAGCAEANLAAPGSPTRPASWSPPAGEVVVAHARAEARKLAPCGVDPLPEGEGASVHRANPRLSLRLPAGAVREDGDGMAAWRLADSSAVTLLVTEIDGPSFAFGAEGADLAAQDECAMPVAGQLSRVIRYLLVRPEAGDTMHVAVADVPVRPGFWILAGVIGRSDEARTRGMAALGTVTVDR